MKSTPAKKLTARQQQDLLAQLSARFTTHPQRHAGVTWSEVQKRLTSQPEKLASLHHMESTGGEPDVVGRDARTGEFLFVDCAPQSPTARQSLCYDREALDGRKKFPPQGCATEAAAAIGVELLDEELYFALQKLGEFDTKTSSWLKTPPATRALGGALYGERRYDRVFIGHNGADSYFKGRGWRGLLRV